ncbi:MAG: hypothetical protein VCF24_14240 [Candidatus Latescibacterota bacterium]
MTATRATSTGPSNYCLGGSADIHERSRFLWDAVTRQFTGYGRLWREFDAFYDWMHHGECYTYIYAFGLADPMRGPDRARALRFAACTPAATRRPPTGTPTRR